MGIYFYIFIIILIGVLCYNKQYEYYTENNIKILHLVLFSHDMYYDKMYNTTSKYYNKFSNVKTIYYTYDNNISNEYELKNDILYIKGTETYIPGILDKTIKTLEYFQYKLDNYNYVVRSNISTIVNFSLLISELNQFPVVYAGGILNDLKLQSNDNTIKNNSAYASGTSIILSIEMAKFLLYNQKYLRRKLVDDLAIGYFFHDFNIVPTSIDDGKFIFVDDIKNINLKKNIFYRNRTENRNLDCIQMQQIIDML